MTAVLEIDSTLTDRYQTTVPETVRRALKLQKRDKIHYSIRSDGAVLLTRATDIGTDDAVLGQFLDFLARDILSHPEQMQMIGTGLVQQIQTLVGGLEIDIYAPLSEEDE